MDIFRHFQRIRQARRGGRSSGKCDHGKRSPLCLERLEERAVPTVNVTNSFAGLKNGDTNDCTKFCPEPPDTVVAAGPKQIVEVVNSGIRFYDKAKGTILATKPLSTFFDPIGPSYVFDPVVTYDEQAGRFFVGGLDITSSTNRSFLDFAVSNTSNPLEGFSEMHKLELTEYDAKGNAYWGDNAKLGWNADAYVITTNTYSFDKFADTPGGKAYTHYKGVQIISIDKSSVLDKNPFTLTEVQTDRDTSNFTMAVATMHDAAPGDPMWFVEERDNTNIRVVKMKNVLSSPPTFDEFLVPVDKYKGPTPGTDGTSLIATNDSRILNAEARNGYLVAAHNVGGVSAVPSAVRWYQIDVSLGSPSLFQQGTIIPDSGVADFFPAIAINSTGDLGLSFMQTSNTEFMSMYVTGRKADDPLGEMRTPILVKSGEAGYVGGRAGDYSGISVDPVTGYTFWVANEYAVPGSFKNWGTWIGNFWISSAPMTTWTKAPSAGWIEGKLAGFKISSFATSDASATASGFTASIDWGDGSGLDSNSAQISGGNGNFDVFASHTYTQDGAYTITVTIQDTATNQVAVASGTTQVAGLIANALDISALEGISTGSTVVATFTDLDAPGPATDYSATIDWSDGSASAGTIVDNGNGTFSVVVDHIYAEEGVQSNLGGGIEDSNSQDSMPTPNVVPSYAVRVQIADADGSTASVDSTAEVFDAPLTATGQPISAVVGIPFTGSVATFTDANPGGTAGEYSATIDWGDGSAASGGDIQVNPDGTFSVLGSHTYTGDNGLARAISVTITDAGGASAAATSVLTVREAALNITVNTISPTEGALFTGVLVGPGGGCLPPSENCTALIDWGNGTSSQGEVKFAGDSFVVIGSTTYLEEGPYTVTITVLDDDGRQFQATGTAVVADAALSGVSKNSTFTEGTLQGQVVASFEDGDLKGFAGDYTATINWGDNTSSPGTLSANGAGFDVTGTHAYSEEGSLPISVTVQDAGGASVTINSSATIVDAPLTGTPKNLVVTGNKNFSGAVATFTDADPGGVAGDYSATITWDDGTTTSGTIIGKGPFGVSGSHLFGSFSGLHTISVAIKDAGGSMTTVTDTVKDPPAESANQLFVRQLYQDLLRRSADDTGLAAWSALIDQGVSRTQVAWQIEQSQEYRIALVNDLYQRLLHRQADPAGLQGFTALLANGNTLEQIEEVITSSDEYYQSRSGGTVDGFLDALYQDGLGRVADAAGRATFTQALASGATRTNVAAAIFISSEYRQHLVEGYYERFLFRAADSAGLANFTTALAKGSHDGDVIAAIVGSDEYYWYV